MRRGGRRFRETQRHRTERPRRDFEWSDSLEGSLAVLGERVRGSDRLEWYIALVVVVGSVCVYTGGRRIWEIILKSVVKIANSSTYVD